MRDAQLVPMLCCPRPSCGKLVLDMGMVRGLYLPRCVVARCNQAWWAMYLEAGLVRPQLIRQLEPEGAGAILSQYRFPDTLARPQFWQVTLNGHQRHLLIQVKENLNELLRQFVALKLSA